MNDEDNGRTLDLRVDDDNVVVILIVDRDDCLHDAGFGNATRGSSYSTRLL